MSQFPTSLLYIGGQGREAEGGATYANISPWTGEEVGRAADASLSDLDAAIAAARKAFDETDWSTDHEARLTVLKRYAQVLRDNRDRLAELARWEAGAPSMTLLTAQCDAPLAALDEMLVIARGYDWAQDIGVSNAMGVSSRRIVHREAVGVVAAISPWNVPLQINVAKVFPALAAGCTVVLKPAPETPWLGAILGELAIEAGVPAGVLNVITAADPVATGEALVLDPRVDMISFTGSTGVGKRIMANASQQLKKVFLELGGKSATIVLDDADLQAVLAMSAGGLFHAGQGCAICTRILVPRARYEEAVQTLGAIMGYIPYGDPHSPDQMMGALISQKQRDRVLDYIRIGKEEGARLVAGGGVPEGKGTGWFVEPTLFADVDNSMRIAQEEIFGPVLVIIPFEDDADAVRIANDSVYGLSGSVWGSHDRAMAVAKRVRTGTMSVNGGVWYGGDSPFGGYKQSGIGREMGLQGFEEYLETKTIAIPDAA